MGGMVAMAHARSWTTTAAATATGLVLLLVTGCAGSDDTPVAQPPASSPVSTPSGTPTPTDPSTPAETATPTGSATPPPSSAPATSATASPTPTTSTTPTKAATPTPSTSPTRAATGAQRGLRSARADVRRVAPQLQTYFDEREYPADRAQLLTTLADAGVTLGAGNTIGGYGLAGSGVDFVLCVQHDGGGWATFDTASDSVDETGATGACPAD